MKNYVYAKFCLIVGVILLLILPYSPMVDGFNEKSVDSKFMDNLKFYYHDEHVLSEPSVYQEKILDYVSDDCLTGSNTLVSLFETISYGNNGLMSSAWPMQCHDSRHTSRSPYTTENITDLEKWRNWRDGWTECGPVLDNDGIIYFTTTDWEVVAVYPDGTMKWRYQTNGYMSGSTPAIAGDGTIYIGCWDDYLYAINSNGTKKWKFLAHDNIASSPAIAEDGTIYFGTMGDGYRIYAVNPNGTEKWHYKTDYKIASDPAIGDDGTIYIGSGDDYFYAMNPNGTLKWRFKTGDEIHGHPSIAEDGTIYIGSWDDYLYALNPDGTMKWKFKMTWGTTGNPAIGEDGTIYVCSDKMYAVYPNGTKRWSCTLGNNRWAGHSSPAISADGTIYVGTHIGDGGGGDIVAVNSNGTERWRKKLATSGGWVDSSPAIGEDGTVYIGSATGHGGYLHAFGPVESNSPPEIPTISGEINGEAGEYYWYTFRAVDPDNNPISFYIDWGDGSEGWKDERASDVKCYYRHTWSEDGNYTIRAKAKDVLGEESDWAYLEVTMPNTKQSSNYMFLRFLEKHPHMFPILRQIVGLEQ